MNRRYFLGASLAAGASVALSARAKDTPSAADHLVVGIMGTGGRGTQLASTYAKIPGVTVAYVCDVDRKHAAGAAAAVEKAAGKPAEPIYDFRKILDDKQVNILVVA